MNIYNLYCLDNHEKLRYLKNLLIEGEFTLNHPTLNFETFSSESLRFDMVNIIRFTDETGNNEWFLIQLTNFVDGYILDGEYFSVSKLPSAEIISLKIIKEDITERFIKKVGDGALSGIILSQFNPFHFIYDQLVTCFNLKKTLDNVFDFVYTDETCFFSSITNGLVKGRGETYIFPCHIPHNYDCVAAEKMHDHFIRNTGEINYSTDLTLWFGIQGQKRAWLQQVEGCITIVNNLLKDYASITLLIDGWTSFSNKPVSNKQDMKVYNDIIAKLDNRVVPVNLIGCDYIKKIEHVKNIDYFVANSGSGAIIPLMFARKTGVLHSNGRLHTFAKVYTDNIRSDNIRIVPREKVVSENSGIAMNDSYSFDSTVIYNLLLDLGCSREKHAQITCNYLNSFNEFNKLTFSDKTLPVDALREIAVVFESLGDIDTAKILMSKALEQRPNGPFIKSKLIDYNRKLGL